MDQVNLLIGGVITAVILLFLFYLSRQRPTSAQQGFLLENPLTRGVAGREVVLDRLSLTPGMRILDAGCGFGRISVPLARRVGLNGEVIALDTQERVLKKLRKFLRDVDLPQLKPLYADIETVGLEKESFDIVVMANMFGEIDDPKKALRQVMRFLKPGGLLSITEVVFGSHYQSRRKVAKLARMAGLREERIFSGKLGYTINLRRPERHVDPWRDPNRGIDLT